MRELGRGVSPGPARSAVEQLCHDVRGSLHVISGYAELLSTQPLDPQSAEYVERIRTAATSLRDVIERAEGPPAPQDHGAGGGPGSSR